MPAHEQAAAQALVACPTGSIGTRGASPAKTALDDFPLRLDGDVYYCGFTSPKSFGGSSYFVRHAGGNWLIDSPKFLPRLVKKFESLGGIAHIFLTHRDDVADAERYAEHFRRAADHSPAGDRLSAGRGAGPGRRRRRSSCRPGFVAIPTPGHTAGHMVLLVDDRYLFTGDHLAWDRDEHRLIAFRNYCWHSWPEQKQSLARLLDYQFEWVLPGHGDRVHLPADAMRREMAALVERINE